MAELFPPVAIRAAEPHEADRLLIEWAHPLGACNRPFGRQDWILDVEQRPVALATGASIVSAEIEGYRRGEVVELARLARAPRRAPRAPTHAPGVAAVARSSMAVLAGASGDQLRDAGHPWRPVPMGRLGAGRAPPAVVRGRHVVEAVRRLGRGRRRENPVDLAVSRPAAYLTPSQPRRYHVPRWDTEKEGRRWTPPA